MIKNPPATDSNHVSNPDGDNPEYVIDRTKLVDLQRKLSDYASKQSATLGNLESCTTDSARFCGIAAAADSRDGGASTRRVNCVVIATTIKEGKTPHFLR